MLIAFGAFRFVADTARSFESEEQSTADGFVITHHVEITHLAAFAAVGGAVLLAISFIPVRTS